VQAGKIRDHILIGVIQNEPSQQTIVVLDHRAGALRDPELRHHLRGRPLDCVSADDRRHRYHRCTAVGNRAAQPRHREDRIDADERVRRADHDRLELLADERFPQRQRRLRVAGAVKGKSGDFG